MSINRNLVLNYLLACVIVTISFSLLTSCTKSEAKREIASASADFVEPTGPVHESTLPFEQSTTEDETTTKVTITTKPSAEPTTLPTTEPTTEAVTTKPVEKTTKKTTKKTTVKTEKTKSTTTKKSETVKTTTEDVPLPKPEASAERPEKLSQELRDRVASAQPDELIGIEIIIVRPTDEEINARVLAEYGLSYPFSEPDTVPVIEPSPDGSPAEEPEEMKYFNAFDEVKSSEYVARIEAFLDGYVPEERKPVWYTKFSTSIWLDANVEEILLYTAAPQVERIDMYEVSFDDVGEPEPSIEVGEPESSIEEE